MNAVQIPPSPRPGPTGPYRIHDFVDDQKRLMHTDTAGQTTLVKELDGRLCRVDTRRLGRALDRADALVVLRDRYPAREDRIDHCRRCRRAVEFLEAWRADVVASGLARAGDGPLAVREEFLEYLLNHDAGGKDQPIPQAALAAFLDHWGHRWM